MEGSSFLCYCYTISFIISCFLASAAAAMAAKHSIISDQDALLFLKAQISHDPNQILTKNWSTSNGSSSVCDWIGVSCAVRHHRVKSLNISNMGLTGTIVPQLGNLSFLSSLDLSRNSFQGDMPSELAQLRRLKVLRLSQNALSGEFPSWVGSLNELESLYLNNNSFTGSIPSSISNLTNLKNLICYQNELSGSIPFQIFNVSSLEYLRLEFNQLYGNLPTTMCPNNLQNLSYISLQSNMLSGPLPSDLNQCSRLTYLDLSHNNFSGLIPKTFWNMENLELAILESNNLVGTISKDISNLISLQALSLADNHLTGTVPKEMNNLTNLYLLNLASNHLTGNIPEELGNLPNLEELGLFDNEMIGTIPEGIFNISSLTGLDLSINHFSGSLPSATSLGLPNLQFFDIYQNMLGGVVPIFISNCSQLFELDLSQNNFKGSIPHFLGNLRSLQFLNLAVNKLTKDPSSLELEFLTPLADCIYLQELQLSFNPLNGILPESLGNLSKYFTKLTAGVCGLSGEIPASVGNLSNLSVMELSENQFIGLLPTSISFLLSLQFLNLESSRIRGRLPCDLFGLQHLSELHLSYNTFSGSIPECIGNTTSLTRLYLDSNKLSSSIPMTLWNLSGLLELYLSNNSLSGSLPNQVGNIKDIIVLDLSMNNLSGNIPDAIGSLLGMEELYLYYNLLEGLIPKSIGSIVSLKNLDLSANNLSGPIPVTLEKLRYLTKFNASYNNLDGPIPDGGPFTKFTWESFISNKGLCGDKKFHVPACHVASAPNKLWTRPHVLILCFGLIATVFVITVIVLYLILRRKNQFQRGEELVQVTSKDRISFYELQHATDGYNERNLLGKGSFGSVYKGTLRDGRVVAVKVFDIKSEGALKSFDVECEMLRNLRHRNLTQVISSCSNFEFKAIVLEFMPNGSLENWLHSGNHFLSFKERVNIMIDVASALQYLHSGYPIPVVHADLKPSNVLLDEDKVAHVCDFGIAKMLVENSITYTNTLATFGYIAPEYGSEGLVSIKCDVYSFGILLMEVFTRKRPDDEMFNESLTLHDWVKNSTNSAPIDIIDDSLLNRIEEKNIDEMMDYMMMIMNVALNCTKKFPKERSEMEEIVATLNKIKLKL